MAGRPASFTFGTAGTYILHLQYSDQVARGDGRHRSPINPTYTFDTEINGIEVVPDTTSIDLKEH